MRHEPRPTGSRVVDAFPLSPMQAGMLVQALRSSPGDGTDIQQISMRLREPLDPALFVYAWYRLVDRHSILRTRLRWEGLDEPVQEVVDAVDLPVTQVDWRGQDPDDLRDQLIQRAMAERAEGFDLAVAPLLRLFVARVGDADWQVLWTFHHVLLDGRSFPIVLRDVFDLYDGLRQRQTPSLPPVVPFREHIQRLSALDLAQAEDHWRHALRGFTTPTPLGIDRTSPAAPGELGSRAAGWGARQQRLSQHAGQALAARARDAGVTVHTLLQAAWALLLYRYGGSSDVVFGTTRAGRHALGDTEGRAVGLYINTVPMRIAVDPAQPVDEWLAQIRAQQLSLRTADQASLARIQSWSEVEPGRALFDSLVVYDHQSLGHRMHGLGRAWPQREFDHVGQTGYPLTLVAYGDDQMLLRLEYDRQRFTDRSMERMLGHLETALASLAEDRTERIGELAWMTDVERAELIGDDALDFGPGQPLHLQFEAQVARTPQAPALTSVDVHGQRVELSYAQLNAQANALAHRLREWGVRPNQLVGLRTERNAALVVGLLAILKAGAAYLPLDPVYPQERVAFMLGDAEVAALVTQRSLSGDLTLPGIEQLCVEDALASPPSPLENLPPVNAPDDLVYVIYTSGSTGKPKGVRITHRNVSRLFAATRHWFAFDDRDVWTLFHSYAFDFSVWELWGALLHGGRLVAVSQDLSRNVEAFHAVLRDERVTVLNQTPTAFRRLIDHVCQGPEEPLSLRYVIFGGEALELQMLRPWFERHGDQRPQLVNMYGITETTVHVTYRPLCLQDLDSGAGSVIGVPIPDLKILLLDPQGGLVPVGVAGELVVCGAGLADGYLKRPELTAERFVPDPFDPRPDARMYRSGDLARRLDNGDIEYLGRIDQQVKIRGFRIELGEIEAQIAQHPRVRQVAVVARQDAPGDKRLAAYLVADGELGPLAADLRERLRAVLPDYMVPAHFIALAQLPLTANGKLDQRALPAPAAGAPMPAASGRPPRTAVEQQLATLWASVLRVDAVDVEQHFFELGGDSILSIQIVARCRQVGLAVTLKDLFDHPTVAALAARIETTRATQAPVATPLVATEPEPQAVLTPIQHWFFHQQFAEAHHWNQSFLFEVPAEWPPAALEQAWSGLLQRHPALTQTFSRQDPGGWSVAAAAPAVMVPLKHVDLSDCDDRRARERIEERCSEVQGGLDFVQGPLARALHFGLGPGRPARLLLAIHHLVVDGVSWRILREDLESLVRAALDGAAPALPPHSDSMARWSVALQRYARSGRASDSLSYWQAVAASPKWVLPATTRLGASQAAWVPDLVLDAYQTRQLLQDIPSRFGTQINAALLSALLRALQRLTGLTEMRVDLEGHGREPIDESGDVSRTVGWFTSLFPVALQLPAMADATQVLQFIHEQLQRVPDRGLSFGALRWLSEDPAVRERLAATAPSPLLFNYLGQFDAVVGEGSAFRFAAESAGPWRSPLAHRTHALEVVAQVRDGRMSFAWHHDALSVTVGAVAALSQALSQALTELLDSLSAPQTLPARVSLPEAPMRPVAATPAAPAHAAVEPLPLQLPRDWLDLPHLPPAQPTAVPPAAVDGSPSEPFALTPMQRLFFTMHEAHPELGLEQWQFRLDGPLDTAVMQRALHRVIERHDILRTRFFADADGRAVQQVVPPARLHALPWTEHDLQQRSADEQARELNDLLERDARTPFDLEQPPLMRVTLLKLAPQHWHFIWATHHLTLDGWSWPLLLAEWSRIYAALQANRDLSLPPAMSFQAYAQRLAKPDGAGLAFWREQVAGLQSPTPLAGQDRSSGPAPAESVTELDAALTADVAALARQWRITPGTVFNAAWSVALAQASGRSQIAFGMTVSGRPAELDGVETLIGPCVNNVPLCVGIDLATSTQAWMTALNVRQRQIAEHQTTPLERIQPLSQVPWRQRLFDSLVVFQNYQVDDDARGLGPQVRSTLVAAPESTNYPLTLAVTMGERWRVRWLCKGTSLTAADVQRHAQTLLAALQVLLRQTPATMGAWLDALPPETRAWASSGGLASPTRIVRREPGRSRREQDIAALWCELFGVDQVGLDDNFFDIGGHSLLLVQAHRLMQERWQLELPVVALLRYPTVRTLARHLDGGAQGEASSVAQTALARVQRLRAAQGRRPLPPHSSGGAS